MLSSRRFTAVAPGEGWSAYCWGVVLVVPVVLWLSLLLELPFMLLPVEPVVLL